MTSPNDNSANHDIPYDHLGLHDTEPFDRDLVIRSALHVLAVLGDDRDYFDTGKCTGCTCPDCPDVCTNPDGCPNHPDLRSFEITYTTHELYSIVVKAKDEDEAKRMFDEGSIDFSDEQHFETESEYFFNTITEIFPLETFPPLAVMADYAGFQERGFD